MPISIDGPRKDDVCRGGLSYMCKRVSESASEDGRVLGPHERRNPVWCRNCDKYMGCEVCAQPIWELICDVCRDWATDAGERKHGKMVRDKARAAALMAHEIDELAKKLGLPEKPASVASVVETTEPEYWRQFDEEMAKHRATEKKGAA